MPHIRVLQTQQLRSPLLGTHSCRYFFPRPRGHQNIALHALPAATLCQEFSLSEVYIPTYPISLFLITLQCRVYHSRESGLYLYFDKLCFNLVLLKPSGETFLILFDELQQMLLVNCKWNVYIHQYWDRYFLLSMSNIDICLLTEKTTTAKDK